MSRIVLIGEAPPLSQRRPRKENGAHLAWIRTLPCLVTGQRINIEAAHIRFADRRFGKRHVGLQEKSDDRWAIPLSADIHRDQHTENERSWWEARNIDPVTVASALWGASGDDEAAEVILREARPMKRQID